MVDFGSECVKKGEWQKVSESQNGYKKDVRQLGVSNTSK
jgi:hypothetical protein